MFEHVKGEFPYRAWSQFAGLFVRIAGNVFVEVKPVCKLELKKIFCHSFLLISCTLVQTVKLYLASDKIWLLTCSTRSITNTKTVKLYMASCKIWLLTCSIRIITNTKLLNFIGPRVKFDCWHSTRTIIELGSFSMPTLKLPVNSSLKTKQLLETSSFSWPDLGKFQLVCFKSN